MEPSIVQIMNDVILDWAALGCHLHDQPAGSLVALHSAGLHALCCLVLRRTKACLQSVEAKDNPLDERSRTTVHAVRKVIYPVGHPDVNLCLIDSIRDSLATDFLLRLNLLCIS
jgi:hypothetical protein